MYTLHKHLKFKYTPLPLDTVTHCIVLYTVYCITV
jgi:hypothetical protein